MFWVRREEEVEELELKGMMRLLDVCVALPRYEATRMPFSQADQPAAKPCRAVRLMADGAEEVGKWAR